MSKGRPAYAAIVTGSVPTCRLWSCATAVTDHERFTTLAEFEGGSAGLNREMQQHAGCADFDDRRP